MSFIGVLTERKNEAYLKKQLEGEKLDTIYFLNENTIENMRNIKFETLLLGKEIEKKQDIIRSITNKIKFLIVNSDIPRNLEILKDLDVTLITYGFNSKATLTTSSIEDNRVMLCLQRNLENIYGEEIESQEMKIETKKNGNSYAVMELTSLLLLYSRKA